MTNEHPLGYRKINLGRATGWRIRIHIWHGEGSEAPHHHRWAFYALPLAGTFTDTRWATTTGDTHRMITAWPSTATGGRRYADTSQRTGLTKLRTYTRRPLRPYRVRYGDIHSYTSVGPGRHITVVLLAPPRTTTSTIYEPN